MLRRAWGWPARYGIAVVFTVFVAALKFAVPAFGVQGPDLFLTVPVAASAVFGGFGPALLATVGATIIAAYFTPPAGLVVPWDANGLDVVGAAHAAARRAEVLDPSRQIGTAFSPSRLLVHGDPARLDQILDNLLKNAISYSLRGTPIEVSIGEDRELGNGIVRVRDQGPGIPAADRERIFERFTRGSAGGSVPGSGIGLFLSNELAARMGGRLYLEETSSAGSVFAIELPLAGGALGRDG